MSFQAWIANLTLNKRNIINLWVILLLFSIFFPIKYTFITSSSFLLGHYSDFTSFSLYLSDLLIILGFVYTLLRKNTGWNTLRQTSNFRVLVLCIAFFLFSALNKANSIGWFYFGRLFLLIVLHGTLLSSFKYLKLNKILQIFTIFSLFVSISATLQFWFQHDFGLQFLGESPLSSTMAGVAKVAAEGTTFLRPYGFFPHPNVLGIFLVTNIIICINLYILVKSDWSRLWLLVSCGASIVGLTLSFSRSAWLALLLGLLFQLGFIWYKQLFTKKFLGFGISLLALGIICFAAYKPLITQRGEVFDQAYTERADYNRTSFRIIKQNPVFGVGPGQSLLHMEQYLAGNYEPWQIQPIHNYFLLSAAEVGVPGAILLALIVFYLIFLLARKMTKYKAGEPTGDALLALTIFIVLIAYVIAMMFDHYFYTIVPTQILLWLMLTFGYSLVRQTKTPPATAGEV